MNGEKYSLKMIDKSQVGKLYGFFNYSLSPISPEYFIPHKTDIISLKKLLKKKCCICLGIFYGPELIGYAIIRLFFPNKGLYGIFIADKWQGKGIGTAVLKYQLHLINKLGFYPYSIVSKRNIKSIRMLQKLKVQFLQDLGDSFLVRDIPRKK